MMRTKKGGGSKFEGLEQDLLFSQIYAGLTLGEHLILSFTFVWDNLPFETFAQILESYHGVLILFLAEWLKVLIAKYVSGHEKILSLPYFIDPVRGDLAKGTTLRRAVLRLKRLLHQLKPLKKVWNSGIVMIELLALIIYVILCFGAPVFSLQAQTLAFACLLLILTFLPVILIQGPDASLLMAAMLDSENDGMNCLTILLRNNAFGTLLGAWLGALPIPLDWDRPWQVWPMTCSLGALAGNAFGSFTTLNGFKKHTISRLPPFGRKKQR